MHELSIAMSILESLQEEVNARGCGPIEAVHIRVGDLSGVVPEALASAFELVAEATPFARARLVIEQVPIVIHCLTCGGKRRTESPEWFCCPECHTLSAELVSGRELEISALEIAA